MTSNSKKKQIALAAILFLIIISIIWVFLKNPQTTGGSRGRAITEIQKILPDNLSELGNLVITNYSEYRANTVRWSAAYFGCLFGAALLSACTGVLIKMEGLNIRQAVRNDIAAIMAAVATLLITLLTLGSFEEKWRSNRIAAYNMENLAYELLKSGAENEKDLILARIQKINEARNEGIVGFPSPPESNAPETENDSFF